MNGAALAFFIRLVTGARIDPRLDVPENAPQRVYFANHSSHLDFIVIWAGLPATARRRVRPVAAAEYWNRGPLRRWLSGKIFRAVLIPRDPAKMREVNPLDLMGAALDCGADLIVFPEGTRSETGRVGLFKPGLYHLAQRRKDLRLIPVYLENLNRILPKGELLPVPLMGGAHFGDPVSLPAEDEPKTAFLTRAREAVLHLGEGTLLATPPPPEATS